MFVFPSRKSKTREILKIFQNIHSLFLQKKKKDYLTKTRTLQQSIPKTIRAETTDPTGMKNSTNSIGD